MRWTTNRKSWTPRGQWINVVGDNVFYAARGAETRFITSGIVRLNVNGTGAPGPWATCCRMNALRHLCCWQAGQGRLHKISLDGLRDDLLVDAKVGYVNVAGGWVFYVNRDDKRRCTRAGGRHGQSKAEGVPDRNKGRDKGLCGERITSGLKCVEGEEPLP